MARFAACFRDLRAPELIHHSVEELVRQRVFALACGYEDLVDHATLRNDPLLATVVGKADPAQKLASASMPNRLELTPADATAVARYRKVVYAAQAVEAFLVDAFLVDAFLVVAFLDAHRRPLPQVVLDLDATDAPIHDTQEGRFFHGYSVNYCCLPLYTLAGDFLLAAKRRCNASSPACASAGPPRELFQPPRDGQGKGRRTVWKRRMKRRSMESLRRQASRPSSARPFQRATAVPSPALRRERKPACAR